MLNNEEQFTIQLLQTECQHFGINLKLTKLFPPTTHH